MAKHAGKSTARSAGRGRVARAGAVQEMRAGYDSPVSIDTEEREQMIREVAYRRFEQRAFTHGHDLDDWLAAESEVERLIAARQRSEGVGSSDAELQQSSSRSILRDEKIKQILRQHPQRDEPKV